MHHSSLQELYRLYELQKNHIVKTPLLYCESLSQLINGSVYIKAENLQKTGAFKFRGALSRLQGLSDSEKSKGLIAYSSGNFARGLATAGRLLGIKVTIVMPADAPQIKVDAARQQEATVILCNDAFPSREEAASQLAIKLAGENDYTLLHPFNDHQLIQGQASVTLELLEQFHQQAMKPDTIICPVGGGSLIAGACLVKVARENDFQLCTAEPEDYSGLRLSLQANSLMTDSGETTSICDALQARTPGNLNFDIVRKENPLALSIQEIFVVRAVQLAFQDTKLVLEPSGAIAIAAIMQKPELFENQTLCVVASGGNVDPRQYRQLLDD